jgi:hypothetical protein
MQLLLIVGDYDGAKANPLPDKSPGRGLAFMVARLPLTIDGL